MADLKISELSELTAPARDDKFPVVDTSASTTKYIQMLYMLTGADKIVAPVGYSGYADYYTDGTDDHIQAQSALDALPSTGGHLHFTGGTFKFADEVSRAINKVLVTGAGDGTIIQWQNSANPTGKYLFRTSSYWTIRSLQISGNKANNTAGGGIYAYQSARLRLEDLYIADLKNDAIRLTGTSTISSHAAQISNVRILNCDGYALMGEAFSYDTEVLDLWIGTCNVGVRIQNGQYFFSNLHVWGCTGNGVEVRSNNNRFINCYLETNGSRGVDLFTANNNTFIGCDIWKNGAIGVNLSSVNKNTFIGCQVHDNVGLGIQIAGTSADNKIIGGEFYDEQSTKTQTYGIGLSGSADRNSIMDNNIQASNHVSGSIDNQSSGTANKFRNNIGYVTENKGTATITSGTTSVAVTHGLSVTPTVQDISVMISANPTNDPGNIWISGISSTQFTINCRNNPGASNLALGWRAVVV